ncbi:hypothetical protein Hypma_008325 [Hypsizygus marmoreus]|uniref:Uncharacterized protein n=1 Tax=Hypsizygus marmoreus TaxID=39966 RepID=A0A369K0R5_HYPMA|nr:hypothetical protein Hypma_008325 [Hypsizygus marmoreus]
MADASLQQITTDVMEINNLPSDMMGEIFLHCVASSASCSLSRRKAPLNLTWVCRSWRQLAYDTPRLWTMLKLSDAHCEIPQLELAIRSWTDLARRHSLSLEYNIPHYTPPILHKILLPLSDRLCHLNLNIRMSQYIALLDHLPLRLPLLESIALKNSRADDDQYNSFVLDLSSCPHLRDVVLEAVPRPGRSGYMVALAIPWAQLTTLKFITTQLPPSCAISILAECTNIVTFETSMAVVPSELMEARPARLPFVLSHLKFLTISWCLWRPRYGYVVNVPILTSLTAPALSRLNLLTVRTRSDVLAEALYEMHQRSQFDLEHFSLAGDLVLDTQDLPKFFRVTPKLRSLRLDLENTLEHRRLVKILAFRLTKKHNLLPELVSLELSMHRFHGRNTVISEGQQMWPGNSKIITTLIQSRTWGDKPSPYAQVGLSQLARVVLGTRRRLGVKDWSIRKENVTLERVVEELRAKGLALEMPIEYVH